MFILGNLFISIGQLLRILSELYILVVIAAVVVTWLPIDEHHPARRLLRQVTEPIYVRLRRWLPKPVWDNTMAIDFTPAVLVLIVWFVAHFAGMTLGDIGERIK